MSFLCCSVPSSRGYCACNQLTGCGCMARRTVIVAGGPITESFLSEQLKNGDRVIAVDRGAEPLLHVGVTPCLVVGDMDSVSSETISALGAMGSVIQRYPRDKERTDLDLALALALAGGPDDIVILGALGQRLDHTITNVALLAMNADAHKKVALVDEWGVSWLVRHHIRVVGREGDVVSLVPLTPTVDGIWTTGLHYQLSGDSLTWGRSTGVHNVMTGSEATVTIQSGLLLVVKTRDFNAGSELLSGRCCYCESESECENKADRRNSDRSISNYRTEFDPNRQDAVLVQVMRHTGLCRAFPGSGRGSCTLGSGVVAVHYTPPWSTP